MIVRTAWLPTCTHKYIKRCAEVASKLKAGAVHVSGGGFGNYGSPFGGYKQSGNGRGGRPVRTRGLFRDKNLALGLVSSYTVQGNVV